MAETNLIRARAAWGDALPDWVEELARACDTSSQAAVAKRIGYSGPTVNQVLAKTYPGNVDKVGRSVRGAFLGATVDCPVEGELPSDLCLAYQRRPFAATNRRRVELYRACRGGCPHSQLKSGGERR